MASVIVLRPDRDAELVRSTVLALLATEGVAAVVIGEPSNLSESAVNEADLMIVAYSAPQTVHRGWLAQAANATSGTTTVIAHLMSTPGQGSSATDLPLDEASLALDLDDWPQSRRQLRSLLPAGDANLTQPNPDWTVEDFEVGLREAVASGDHRSAGRLVKSAVGQIATAEVIPTNDAESTMKTLQNARYFELEQQLGSAYVEAGVRSPEVARRFGQASIETGDFDLAEDVLRDVHRTVSEEDKEWVESGGLLARSQKQRYFDEVEAGNNPSPELLDGAIDRYSEMYQRSKEHIWPGINAVSLQQRAERDGIDVGAGASRPELVASEILETIDSRERNERLESWDYATAAEAHLANNDVERAAEWLDRYTPTANSFELGSTLRQFKEVIQVDQRYGPEGRKLAEDLEGALAARRGGDSLIPSKADSGGALNESIPLLVQVTVDNWEPPDQRIKVVARMGRTISVTTDQEGLDLLIHDSSVKGMDRSRPQSALECHTSIPFVGGTAVHEHIESSERGEEAIVAVVDGGIDVMHQAFLGENGTTRIARVWNQRDTLGDPPDGFYFGTEYTADDINRFLSGDETAPQSLRDSSRHGTHVASICAGRAVSGDGSFTGGMAPEAAIIAVIPNSNDESIGYSTSHLAALSYIDRVASELGKPVVVNVSMGQNAGAHDGLSPLEAAFNSFSDSGLKPGRVVVKSAGNERSAGGHAAVPLAPQSATDLPWRADEHRVLPDRTDEIQVWCPYGNEYTFQLFTPGGESSNVLGPGHLDGHLNDSATFTSGNTYTLAFTESHDHNGMTRLFVEIARGSADLIEAGDWKLRIVSGELPVKGEVLHAWIERDDKRPISFTDHMDSAMTLSIPGTAESVITVGAVSASTPFQVAEFSSYGPTFGHNTEKPDLAAPGVDISAAASMTGTGVIASSGTSMAAPHVSGAIALALSAAARQGDGLAAKKIRTMLTTSTKNFDGAWRHDQGFGVLDVENFLKKLRLL